MRKTWTLVWKLLLIAAVAGVALAVTNQITKGPIEEGKIAAANEARRGIMPEAEEFEEITDIPEGIDSVYAAKKGGEVIGYTAQVTVNGYGGKIEVTVGMSVDGIITGISVGGSEFSETPGLGEKTKSIEFRSRFLKLKFDPENPFKAEKTPQKEKENEIQAVTSATISSQAVTDGVDTACGCIMEFIAEGGE